MQTFQESQSSNQVHRLYRQPSPEISSYLSSKQVLDNVGSFDYNRVADVSTQACTNPFFTLESFPATAGLIMYDNRSTISSSSNRSTRFPQGSQSCASGPHPYSDITYGSPVSGSSGVVDYDNELRNKLRELEMCLLGPDPDMMDSDICTFNGGMLDEVGSSVGGSQMMEVISRMDVKQVLILCAQTVADEDISTTSHLMDVLGRMVSVSGTPLERLAAYMLEGLRARLEYSGYTIYKKLRCDQPTGKELLSYMHILATVCPYYRFAYVSSNAVIQEAIENETRIHIIDFQIAMGSQWACLIESLAKQPNKPQFIRITGVDDDNSTYARGGGLDLIGERLAKVAESCGIAFEFHAAAMSGCEVNQDNLAVWPGEAVVVNFPFMLHHMPDESVSTANHRDRLLRLLRSIGPKVITLVEQEANTNTAPFLHRFLETLDYYTAMFESIDVACPRNDRKRINAEQHCLARDIVNLIACEDAERVERHELLGKWKARFTMAGFRPCPLSYRVKDAVWNMMREYHVNYKINEWDGGLYLGWKQRALCTLSAWR